MSTIIDLHEKKSKIGGFLIGINLKVNVSLVEKENMVFEFCVDYTYSGILNGRSSVCLPVNGNASEERHEGGGLYIHYTISNWNATESNLSCDVTVSVQYKLFGRGSYCIFDNQRFAGPRPALSSGTI